MISGLATGFLYDTLKLRRISGRRVTARFALTLTVVTLVISSPIVMLFDPTQALAATNKIDTSNYHSNPQVLQTFVPSKSAIPTTSTPPPPFSSQGSDFTTQAALTGVNARPSNNIVGVNSYYEVIFTTATAGIIKFIDIKFPAGTIIGSAPLLLIEKEGIGDGTATKVSNTQIRYTVTSAVNVPAGTKIRLELFNIVNPPLAGSYAASVTTRNAGGTVIDGPTGSTINTIKQISTGQIADNSITSTKPAESFMRKVTVQDNADGNAIGWNPNGITTTFTISEPSVIDNQHSFVSIIVANTPPPGCFVVLISAEGGSFEIGCSTAPVNGVTLFYVVENLPPNAPPF